MESTAHDYYNPPANHAPRKLLMWPRRTQSREKREKIRKKYISVERKNDQSFN